MPARDVDKVHRGAGTHGEPAGDTEDQENEMSSGRATSTERPVVPGASDVVPRLFSRWQTDHDDAAREALVLRYMPLARRLVRRYARSAEPLEDLLQVASLGLLKALDRFDPAR